MTAEDQPSTVERQDLISSKTLETAHPNGRPIRAGLKRPERNDDLIFEKVFPDSEDGKMLSSLLVLYLLKQEHRLGWPYRSACDDPELLSHPNESVASHAWGVAQLIMNLSRQQKFQEELPNFNTCKAIEMALIHDVPELITGDITPIDGISPEEKHRLERVAMEKIIDRYPEHIGQSIFKIYNNYEERGCRESSFVKDCDKLDFMINSFMLERQGFSGFSEFYPNTIQSGFSTRIVTDLAALLTSTRNTLFEQNLLYKKAD